MRTLQRYQTAIRDHLQLKPAYSREARTVPVRKVFEAAQVMVIRRISSMLPWTTSVWSSANCPVSLCWTGW
jgi:hypothetical protein